MQKRKTILLFISNFNIWLMNKKILLIFVAVLALGVSGVVQAVTFQGVGGVNVQQQTTVQSSGTVTPGGLPSASDINEALSHPACTLGGVTIASGSSYKFYKYDKSTTCNETQVRTCTDGVLSGSADYKYKTCVKVSNPQDASDYVGGAFSGLCSLDGQIIANGNVVTAYKNKLGDCSVHIKRKCNNGKLSGSDSYKYHECTPVKIESNSGGAKGYIPGSAKQVPGFDPHSVTGDVSGSADASASGSGSSSDSGSGSHSVGVGGSGSGSASGHTTGGSHSTQNASETTGSGHTSASVHTSTGGGSASDSESEDASGIGGMFGSLMDSAEDTARGAVHSAENSAHSAGSAVSDTAHGVESSAHSEATVHTEGGSSVSASMEASAQVEERNNEYISSVSTIADITKRYTKTHPKIANKFEEVVTIQTGAFEATQQAIMHAHAKGRVSTFFFGPDYKSLKKAKENLEKYQEQLKKLQELRAEVKAQADQKLLDEAIAKMKKLSAELSVEINTKEGSFSLFGWLVRWFVK